MNELILNKTPMRTSRNFGMNEIKVADVEIPSQLETFDAVQIVNPNPQVTITRQTKEETIAYGVGEMMVQQVQEHSNCRLHINIVGKTQDTIFLGFPCSAKEKNLVEYIQIEAEENASAHLVLQYSSEDEDVFHNGMCTVVAHKNANISITFLNLLGQNANHFYTFQNDLREGAHLNYTMVDFGGKNRITNYYTKEAENAVSQLDTIYIGENKERLDLNYITELFGKQSKVKMNVQGALKDEAKKNFKGTIDFKKGASQAVGSENEYCILLSDHVRSKSLPMLLCSEEDVDGEHSAAAGKVDEKELFYLMSRGFSYQESLKLMVRARFHKVIQKLEDDLKEKVLKQIDQRLKD